MIRSGDTRHSPLRSQVCSCSKLLGACALPRARPLPAVSATNAAPAQLPNTFVASSASELATADRTADSSTMRWICSGESLVSGAGGMTALICYICMQEPKLVRFAVARSKSCDCVLWWLCVFTFCSRKEHPCIITITSAQRSDVLELFSRSSPSFQRARFLVRPVLFQSLKCLRVANVFFATG